MKPINKKQIIIPALLLAIAGTTFFGVTSALAQGTNNQESTLVQKIASKFNLNKDEVQKVFDEEHVAREVSMQARNEERLTALVTSGKITEAQRILIINKQKELKANRDANKDSFKNLTPNERKSRMDARKTEFETWAKTNGIDTQYLIGGFGSREFGHRGPGM